MTNGKQPDGVDAELVSLVVTHLYGVGDLRQIDVELSGLRLVERRVVAGRKSYARMTEPVLSLPHYSKVGCVDRLLLLALRHNPTG